MAVSSNASKAKKRQVPVVVVHVNATFNNTIISVTDQQGDVLAWSSSGKNGFKGSRKSTPYAGQVSVEEALERAITAHGIKTISVKVKGPGTARESAVRAISSLATKYSLAVTLIKDVTGVPHNGCRPPKRRRV
ncbi:MAG: 30S ribosomal protein S11 [Alphaproteobacteria bacterium]|jgi:small subunit ribosomal protein S11|nr:30S ribosomal protein S11 [Candidatus Jidaibacter sp.]